MVTTQSSPAVQVSAANSGTSQQQLHLSLSASKPQQSPQGGQTPPPPPPGPPVSSTPTQMPTFSSPQPVVSMENMGHHSTMAGMAG